METERGVSWFKGLTYGMGYLGTALMTQVVVTWTAYFYAPAPGRGLTEYLPVGLVGLAMGIGRIVDAVADPLVGIWSDNTRSRWGRRRPFLLIGTPFLALFFALLWWPPVAGVSGINFWYLAFVLSAFFFFFTVVVAPYLALLPEMARGQRERVGLAAWQGFFNVVGVAVAALGAAVLIERAGFGAMGMVLGLVVLLSFYIPALVVREKGVPPSNLGFREGLLITLRNRPFRYYVAGQLFCWFGFNMVMMGVPYYVTVLMGLSEGDVGLALGVTLAVALAGLPGMGAVAARKGTKSALMFTMAFLAAVMVGLASIGRWPLPLSSAVQGLVLIGAAGIPLAGLFVLPNAIVAEITDYDEIGTGRRREAVYFGVQGLLLKAAMGLSSLFMTYMLHTFGYSSQAPLGVVLSGPAAAFFVLFGLAVFARYPLGAAPAAVTGTGKHGGKPGTGKNNGGFL